VIREILGKPAVCLFLVAGGQLWSDWWSRPGDKGAIPAFALRVIAKLEKENNNRYHYQ
jgi:hypothetical protein